MATIIGTSGNDELSGLGEDDLIKGLGGADILFGLAGNDEIIGADGDDTIYGAAGEDRIDGNAGNDVLNGGEDRDTLRGGGGHDTLDGGLGTDWLQGGRGNDTYIVDAVDDRVTENIGEGTDTVQSYAQYYFLPEDVENIVLMGNAVEALGNDLDNRLVGNDLDNYLTGNGGDDTMRGGLGNDRYSVNSSGDVVFENAGEGTDTVHSWISYTLRSNFENLVLSANGPAIRGNGNGLNNEITGNERDNELEGRGGNDRLDGGEGADRMMGGAGDDMYFVNQAGDLVIESAGEGRDSVYSSVDYTLEANVETLSLVGFAANGIGNAIDNVLVGNQYANRLEGLDGDDRLDGFTGIDEMIGGLGNDTYVVMEAADRVIELPGGGDDLIESWISYALGDDLENLVLMGSATVGQGNALNNGIVGNNENNRLFGGIGNDSIFGGNGNDEVFGGTGNDYINGANDNDSLAGEDGDDTITGGFGNDQIDGGAGRDMLDGSVDNDMLYGGLGDDTLDGGDGDDRLQGDAGIDIMRGGAGNDLYIVDHGGDQTIDIGGGQDLVHSTASHTLGEGVESLLLQGSAHINGTGNGLDNYMEGNSGQNVLRGLGGNDYLRGSSNDTLIGGTGDDRYHLSDSGTVVENAGEGIDSLVISVFGPTTYVLQEHVENLDFHTSLEDFTELHLNNSANVLLVHGTTQFSIFGYGGDDTMTLRGGRLADGGEGNDRIESYLDFAELLGGAGNDTLILMTGQGTLRGGDGDDILSSVSGQSSMNGGAGSDQFYLGSLTARWTSINDFNGNEDVIAISDDLRPQLQNFGAGNFYAAELAVAQDANDYLLYSTSNRMFYFDPDGNGAQSAIFLGSVTVQAGVFDYSDILIT